jgi:methyltransferase
MKIVLIYPDTNPMSIIPRAMINIEPLGLEYLAGDLYDHDVTILDFKVEKNWHKALRECDPDIIGLTGTVVHTSRILEIANYAKAINPTVVTVVGGTQATLVPDDFSNHAMDFLIKGQQPGVFRKLVEAIETGRDPQEVEGIMISSPHGWVSTRPTDPINDLNHLPMPRRNLTARYRASYRHLFWKPVAMMISSVGCPHACNFCPCPKLTGHRVLRRSPEMFIRELLEIQEPYIYISDDNLFFDYRHAWRIAELIRRTARSKQFYVLSRVDDVVKHPDLVEKWAAIGLKKVFLGLESPSDDEIRALNKKGSVDENSRAVEILHANGVDTLGAFIIQPDYTREDFDRVLEYMDRMKIYYFEFTILTPFPGTEFFEESLSRISSQDARVFDLAHCILPTAIPSRKFHKEFFRLNLKASSPIRAIRIRPTVSPFSGSGFFRQIPQLVGLYFSAKRAYRNWAN